MIISERKYKEELQKAFARGFEYGIQHEKEMRGIRKTLNEARAEFGLPPIPLIIRNIAIEEE